MRLNRVWRGALDTLSVRLSALLAVALLPIGMVAFVQTSGAMREARERSEAALTGEVLQSIQTEMRLIQRAQGLVRALAALPLETLRDDMACNRIMQRVKASTDNYSLVGFIPLSGRMSCSSSGQTMEFSGNPLFEEMAGAEDFAFVANLRGPVSGTSILGVSHVVFDGEGARAGIVSVSIPQERLSLLAASERASGSRLPLLVTFDAEGELLTASIPMEEARALLPADRVLRDLQPVRAVAFTTGALNGEQRTYAAVTLVQGELFALGTWSSDVATGLVGIGTLPPFVLPGAMWLASLLVAVMAAEGLVARHIRALRCSITAFAGGNRAVIDLDFEDAPRELREVAVAYEAMTDTILKDEAGMEDMVHQKEVLLREVHHRVKNNLQLIASIMNMQMRQARSVEAKSLMQGLRDRVMSLATIHRGLYQTSGLTDVRANELLDDIVRQLMRMGAGPGRRFDLRSRFDPVRLTPDQAVPLALLLTEAVTNAMKYASAADGLPVLDISLRREGVDRAILRIANSTTLAGPGGEMPESSGLGSQLVTAFAHQLGGTAVTENGGGEYSLTVNFALRALAEAEARHSDSSAVDAAEG
ncbi:MAG: sensor histidine kinase [Gemmobacter sp.]